MVGALRCFQVNCYVKSSFLFFSYKRAYTVSSSRRSPLCFSLILTDNLILNNKVDLMRQTLRIVQLNAFLNAISTYMPLDVHLPSG